MDDTHGKISVHINHGLQDIESIGNFPIISDQKTSIYLRDIANIISGPIDIRSYYTLSNSTEQKDAVFLGIAKLKGTNSVITVEKLLERIEELRKKMPKNIEMHIIQNE